MKGIGKGPSEPQKPLSVLWNVIFWFILHKEHIYISIKTSRSRTLMPFYFNSYFTSIVSRPLRTQYCPQSFALLTFLYYSKWSKLPRIRPGSAGGGRRTFTLQTRDCMILTKTENKTGTWDTNIDIVKNVLILGTDQYLLTMIIGIIYNLIVK